MGWDEFQFDDWLKLPLPEWRRLELRWSPLQRVWVTPNYDAAGNMIVMPRPDDPTRCYYCRYDAWHRLVEVSQELASATGIERQLVTKYAYDGLGRQIVKRRYDHGKFDEARHCYHPEKTPGSAGGLAAFDSSVVK